MSIIPILLFVASPTGALPEPAAPLRALIDLERPLWMAAVVALLIGVWLLRRVVNRHRPEPTSVPLPPPAARPSSAFRARVDALREQTDGSGEYRRGCHALARAVREELQSKLGSGSSSLAMTATELAVRSADPKVDALVVRLREVRFARTHPKGPQFHSLCSDALYALDRDGG